MWSVIIRCPNCGNELDEDTYCFECLKFFDEDDYDSMIDNGDTICLNCTYWSVSPHGSAYGMICRRGYPTEGPGDSCFDFVKESQHSSYGNNGEYQFNTTRQAISSKLFYWKNSR